MFNVKKSRLGWLGPLTLAMLLPACYAGPHRAMVYTEPEAIIYDDGYETVIVEDDDVVILDDEDETVIIEDDDTIIIYED